MEGRSSLIEAFNFSHFDFGIATRRNSTRFIAGNGKHETKCRRAIAASARKSTDTVGIAGGIVCARLYLGGNAGDLSGGNSKLFEKYVEFY